MEALENFTQAINLPNLVAQVRDFSLSSWTKPQPDWLKLNGDAALDKISKRMGGGS
jgi:vancomycin resistance protein YoaR